LLAKPAALRLRVWSTRERGTCLQVGPRR